MSLYNLWCYFVYSFLPRIDCNWNWHCSRPLINKITTMTSSVFPHIHFSSVLYLLCTCMYFTHCKSHFPSETHDQSQAGWRRDKKTKCEREAVEEYSRGREGQWLSTQCRPFSTPPTTANSAADMSPAQYLTAVCLKNQMGSVRAY